jgi:DNA-binding NarL/FixJ family response regulator
MKILVVDDHVLIREALRGVLNELRGDITVLEAADNREAMRLIGEHPDLGLILLDLNLPDGFSVLSELTRRISVVVMSAQQDHDSLVKALNQGARGFIPKSATREVILGAVQLVISGGVYVPPQALPAQVSPADLGLTEREMDVLRPFMQGNGLGDGDLPEAPLPVVPPSSPTRGPPQGERLRKSPGFLTAESNRSAPDTPADEAGA